MPEVNPRVLEWARETAGLSIGAAANALNIKDSKKRSASEKLEDLERGASSPSRSMLKRMAQKYRRPLLAFYLLDPPQTGDRGRDFRCVPGAEPPEYDPTLDALIRGIRSRQSVVRSLLEDEENEKIGFVNSIVTESGSDSLAQRIIETIEFNLDEYRKEKSISKSFSYLREKIESTGVFVVLAGNLGSHHTNISSSLFRGFAIADDLAPFIVINDQDAHVAWSFTALHELAHIWLGETGLSGAFATNDIEQFCNAVAGEILLPRAEIDELAHLSNMTREERTEQIAEFSRARKISRPMVAYKLFLTGHISEHIWQNLSEEYRREWEERKAEKSKKKDGDSKGPSYYVVKRHRMGEALLHLMQRALGEGNITYTKAGQVLGVKPRNVDPLLRGASSLGGG